MYIFGRREESLKETISQCPNGTVHSVVGDVTSKDSLRAFAERVKNEQGFVNVVFANSGIGGPGLAKKLSKDRKPTIQEYQEALWDVPMEDFTQALHVNVTGALYTATAFLDLLDAGNKAGNVKQKSQVIITSSIAGFNRSIYHNPAYPASKAAVTHLAKVLATHLTQYHIRVNVVAPGLYPSEMTAGSSHFKEGKHPSEEGALSPEACPLERAGSEHDMAANLIYMMGAGGAYLSGSVLLTDGGRLGQIPATY